MYLKRVVGNEAIWDRFEPRAKISKEQNLKNFKL